MKPRTTRPELKRKRMRPLIIGEKQKKEIAVAVEAARKLPNRLEDVMSIALPLDDKPLRLVDRKSKRPPNMFTVSVDLPVGYRASFSFEYQPTGLFRHLSIGVDEEGALPGHAAILMIAKEFGFIEIDGTWLEEFEPGQFAVNLIELVPDGHTH